MAMCPVPATPFFGLRFSQSGSDLFQNRRKDPLLVFYPSQQPSIQAIHSDSMQTHVWFFLPLLFLMPLLFTVFIAVDAGLQHSGSD